MNVRGLPEYSESDLKILFLFLFFLFLGRFLYPSPSLPLSKICMLSCFSHVQLFAILWTVDHQAPLLMGFSRQEHWSGLPCSSFRGSSRPRDRTCICRFCIAGRFLPRELTECSVTSVVSDSVRPHGL